jgi:hypothetical protein
MLYWTKARRWTRATTKTYGLGKVIPALLAAMAQWFLFQLRPLYETLIIVGTLLVVYSLLWALEFLYRLFLVAPAAIYESDQATITKLRAEIARFAGRSPAEQYYFDILKRALDKRGDDAVSALRHLRSHRTIAFKISQGRPVATTLIPDGMSNEWAYGMLSALASDGVLKYNQNLLSDGQEETYEIAQGMISIIDGAIHPESCGWPAP